jgi:glycosyltransferase involved in cell wall biosynthesis
MPKVSVIIPTFNCEPYVRECVLSVACQTERDLEIIVVDDGSTDGTLEVLKNLERADGRISVVSAPRTGFPGTTRNRGLALARGRYIAFLDGDDLYHREKVSRSVACLEKLPNLDLVFHDCARFTDDHREKKEILQEIGFTSLAAKYLERISDDIYNTRNFYIFMSVCTIPLLTCSVMCKRSLLDLGILWFRENLITGEDIEQWLRLARCCQVGFLNRTLSYYRNRPGSLTSNTIERLEDSIQVHTENLQSGREILTDQEARVCKSKIAGKLFDLGYQYFRRNKRREARIAYRKAMTLEFGVRTLEAYLKTFAPEALVRLKRRHAG